MIIFISMLVPFITAAVLWWRFRHVTTWWEILTPFGVSIVVSCILQFLASHFLNLRTEYWTGWITHASYFEAWNEKVHYTVQVPNGTYTTGTGRNRITHTRYRTEHRTRIDYHPARWEASGSNGENYSLSQVEYEGFAKRWGPATFINLHRNFYTINGNQYTVYSKNTDIEVITSLHRYENRVAVSKSVFNYKPPSKEDIKNYSLVDYPELSDKWNCPMVLGPTVFGSTKADRALALFNARHGAARKVRVWFVVFKNQPLAAAFAQQSLWKNGNPNDFVLCVGVNDRDEVAWGHSFSWTDRTDLTIEGRNQIANQIGKKVDLLGLVDWVGSAVPSKWQLKSFKKDFAYITLPPPMWAIVVSVLITVACNIAISFWIITNEFAYEVSRAYRN